MYIFSFLYHCQDFLLDLTVYMSNTAGVLWQAGTAYPSRAPEFTPGFLVGSVLLSFKFFVLFYYVSFVLRSMLWCLLRFLHKNYVQFDYLVICRRDHAIYVICVFLHKAVSNTYCAVFLFFFVLCTLFASFSWFSMFDCPFSVL